MRIDGMDDAEYRRLLMAAVWLRGYSDDTFAGGGRVATAHEIASGPTPVRTCPPELFDRPEGSPWDHADWLEFLHSVSYKPGWRVDVQDAAPRGPYQPLQLVVTSDVEDVLDALPKRAGITYTVHPREVDSDQRAEILLASLIDEVERAITTMWLRRAGRPIR